MVVYPTQVRNRPPLVSRINMWTTSGQVAHSYWPNDGYSTYQTGSEMVQSYRTGLLAPPEEDAFSGTTGSQADFHRELVDTTEDYRPAFSGQWSGNSDNGHEFISEKSIIGYPSQDCDMVSYSWPYGYLRYKGMVLPCNKIGGSLEYPADDWPEMSEIIEDGTKAIGWSIPNKPHVSIANFLGELRERMPELMGVQLLKDRANATKASGAEVLNYQFGLRPFINDIQKMAVSVLDANKRIDQYTRDSGRLVRRKRTLGSSSRYEEMSTADYGGIQMQQYPSFFSDLSPYFFATPGSLSVSETRTDSAWFSGAFTYYVDQANTFLGRMKRFEEQANHLLGTRITVSTVWELTPWSWLFDWFSDASSFIANVDLLSSDSTVLKYGYVMHSSSATRSYVRSDLQPMYGGRVPGTLRVDYTRKRKTRYRATPYGFGLDVASFSPTRWSILAALGMTRGGNNLGRN